MSRFLSSVTGLLGLLLTGTLLCCPLNIAAQAQNLEVDSTLTEGDSGDVVPASLIRGRISSQAARYILGPGDEISIKIRDLKKYDQNLTIRPDGYGTIHPFGEVKLIGTDIQGLQDWLKEKFKYYLLDPQVTVSVETMRPALIYVSGAVNKPGTYQFLRQGLNNSNVVGPGYEKVEITLTNVLTKAGGINDHADIDHVKVVHASTGYEETYNLRNFLQTGVTEDIWLLPGDSIIVPEMDQAMDPETFKLVSRSNFYKDKFPVVVLGAVRNQGEVQLDPTNNSLNAAVSLAGGFVKGISAEDQIVVQRPTNNGRFNRWVVDRTRDNLALLPGDVIYVTHSKMSTVRDVLATLTAISQPFFFGAGGLNFVDSTVSGSD